MIYMGCYVLMLFLRKNGRSHYLIHICEKKFAHFFITNNFFLLHFPYLKENVVERKYHSLKQKRKIIFPSFIAQNTATIYALNNKNDITSNILKVLQAYWS